MIEIIKLFEEKLLFNLHIFYICNIKYMSNTIHQTIFIHIAAYRDTELIHTINNALSRAQNQNRLIFGICLQDAKEIYDNFPYKNNPRFRILYFHFNESKGCCWARNKVDSLIGNEDYILQIDSHMRFVQNWDTLLISYLSKCPSNNPILSTYVNGYEQNGKNDSVITDTIPCRMVCGKFENKLVAFHPEHINDNHLFNNIPQHTLFMAAGFIFARRDWKQRVPYDPNLYFVGEEHTLAARSFTHGYDIYYPPVPILFHLYVRKEGKRQWDDVKNWTQNDQESRNRVHNLLVHGADYGIYGLGKVRTMNEYQKISGINYLDQTLSPNARVGLPNYTAKMYKTIDSVFHTHDFKIWHEHTSKMNSFKFAVISSEPHKIILRDSNRNIDVSLEESSCKWKDSRTNDWKSLGRGLFIHSPGF